MNDLIDARYCCRNCAGACSGLPCFLRRLALPRTVKHCSLTTLREKLVKIGAKVTRHSKYVTFQLAEMTVTRMLVRGDPRPHARGSRCRRRSSLGAGAWEPETAKMLDAGGKVRALRASKPDQGNWRAMIPAMGIQESGQQVRKWRKIPPR